MTKLFFTVIILFSFLGMIYAHTDSTNNNNSMIINDNSFEDSLSMTINFINDSSKTMIRERKYGWDSPMVDFGNSISPKGDTNAVNKIRIATEPSNAQIFFENELIAYTPDFINNNFDKITLIKTDYKKKQVAVDSLMNNPLIKLEFTGERKNKKFVNSDWFKVVIGGAVLSGAVSAYFKIKADNRYNDYLTTRNKSLLKDIDRYDIYSGISFGILQINFGILIYHFLNE